MAYLVQTVEKISYQRSEVVQPAQPIQMELGRSYPGAVHHI